MIETKIVSGVMAASRLSALMIPSLSGFKYVTRYPCFSSFLNGARIAECSIAVVMMWSSVGSFLSLFVRASTVPKTARLSLSVPLPVKINSPYSQFRSSEIVVRASSIAFFADRP